MVFLNSIKIALPPYDSAKVQGLLLLCTYRRTVLSTQYQVNFSIAFKACRHFLRLHCAQKVPDVEGLTRKHTLPVRPSRNFARRQRFQVPVSFTYRF